MLHLLQIALLFVFPILVVFGGLRDLSSYIIPNWISAAMVAAFVPAALVLGVPFGDIGLHLGVGAAGLAIGMAMFALGWVGGGDAKLFAASLLWLGWSAAASFLFYTCLAGGGLALALLALRSDWVRPFVLTGPPWFARLAEPGGGAPYGVAIAIGALFAYPASTLPMALGS